MSSEIFQYKPNSLSTEKDMVGMFWVTFQAFARFTAISVTFAGGCWNFSWSLQSRSPRVWCLLTILCFSDCALYCDVQQGSICVESDSIVVMKLKKKMKLQK